MCNDDTVCETVKRLLREDNCEFEIFTYVFACYRQQHKHTLDLVRCASIATYSAIYIYEYFIENDLWRFFGEWLHNAR